MRLILAAALAAFLWVGTADAVGLCDDRARVVETLRNNYGELVVAVATGRTGEVIEVFASRNGETWTIVVTRGSISCLVMAGENWQVVQPTPAGKGT